MENRFIVYGAGKRGKNIYDLLNMLGKKDALYGYCDIRYKELAFINEKKVYSYEEIKMRGGVSVCDFRME